jgi:enoyl-CoA hydratase
MSAYQNLLVDRVPEGVATVTLNRPDRRNTLSLQLRAELHSVVAALEADPAVRVLVLTGAGDAFCAGLELAEWGAPGVAPAAAAYELDAVAALLGFTGPIIGAVNGPAVTGGLELALACDLLVASSAASFCDSHALVGLLPGWGGSVRLARRVGLARAKELALTGRFLGAAEAERWGLVNYVVPPEQLLTWAHALAGQMLAAATGSLRAYKRLLDDEDARTFGEALALERRASLAANPGVSREELETRLQSVRARRPRRA